MIHRVKLELLDQLFAVNKNGNDMLDFTEGCQLRHFHSDHDYFAALMDGSIKRFAYNHLKFLIPNQADKSVVVLPEALGFLYYFIRPARIITTRLIRLVTNNRSTG